MRLLWLVMTFLPLVWSHQPRCKLTTLSSQAPGTTRGEVVCTCRSFQPTYTGNLNFVKGALAGAARLDGRLDIVLSNCSHLQLELNFRTLGRRPVDLRIENSGSVRVVQVELAAWEGHNAGADGLPHVQGLEVQGVKELVLQGAISCARCTPGQQGLLNIQVENVGSLTMSRVSAAASVKLTAKHLKSVVIEDSTFQVLPWPGIFFYNTTSVLLTRNRFEHSSPRSISITEGRKVEVSYNLLDVSEVLKVEQYPLVVVKCNRIEEGERLLEEGCQDNALIGQDGLREVAGSERKTGEVEEEVTVWYKGLEDILLTVLAVSDTYGLVWLLIASILVLTFLLGYLLHSCCRRQRQQPSSAPALSALEEILSLSAAKVHQHEGGEEAEDEYSNSSRAHLAHAVDPFQDPLLMPRPPQYVRVQGVREEQGEDGVVCGSLTLGPSFAVREASEPRTLTNNILKKQTFSKV